MSAYQAQITDHQRVREEFDAAASKFAAAAEGGLPPEHIAIATTLDSLHNEDTVTTYAQHLPFVQRFVTAEMDADAPSKRGMGRLADGDPPPRLAAKYRKRLRSEEAQRDIGLAAERLVLSGFAAQAAFFKEELLEKGEDESWAMWVRHLSGYYNDTSDLVSRARNEENSNLGVTGTMIITLANHGGEELIEGFETYRVIRGRRINTWHNARALTYFMLFVGAGRALHHVLSDKVDETFGSAQSLQLLEDYTEKRSMLQVIAKA